MTYRRWLGVGLLLLGIGTAEAQTDPSCVQLPALACLSSTEDVTGPWNFLGAAPFSFEGSSADASEVNVAVVNPTTDRTLTIPNANSAVPTNTGLPCTGGEHISDFNVTTGVFTCSPDSGGGGHNLLSATHTDTVAGAVQQGDLVVGNGTPAWARMARGNSGEFLTTAGSALAWATISSSNIGPGDLAGVFATGVCDGTNPSPTSCTLSQTPAAETAIWAFHRGLFLRLVTTTPGINEIDFTAASTVAFNASQGVGTGADSVIYFLIR